MMIPVYCVSFQKSRTAYISINSLQIQGNIIVISVLLENGGRVSIHHFLLFTLIALFLFLFYFSCLFSIYCLQFSFFFSFFTVLLFHLLFIPSLASHSFFFLIFRIFTQFPIIILFFFFFFFLIVFFFFFPQFSTSSELFSLIVH